MRDTVEAQQQRGKRMERSKTWLTMDGMIGLEVGRDDVYLHLVIDNGWPFPSAPIKVPRKECRLLEHGEQPQDMSDLGEAPF